MGGDFRVLDFVIRDRKLQELFRRETTDEEAARFKISL
jgi:hypothetical protein